MSGVALRKVRSRGQIGLVISRPRGDSRPGPCLRLCTVSVIPTLPPTLSSMSFLSRCCNAAKSPFSLLGITLSRFFIYEKTSRADHTLGFGSIRTATKRAGGTVHNHGGSPGKRLGVKKFSGASQPEIYENT